MDNIRSWRYGIGPLHPELAMCSLGLGMPHSIRSRRYAVWAQVWPTASGAGRKIGVMRRGRQRLRRRSEGVAPLFQSTDPHLAGGNKYLKTYKTSYLLHSIIYTSRLNIPYLHIFALLNCQMPELSSRYIPLHLNYIPIYTYWYIVLSVLHLHF